MGEIDDIRQSLQKCRAAAARRDIAKLGSHLREIVLALLAFDDGIRNRLADALAANPSASKLAEQTAAELNRGRAQADEVLRLLDEMPAGPYTDHQVDVMLVPTEEATKTLAGYAIALETLDKRLRAAT